MIRTRRLLIALLAASVAACSAPSASFDDRRAADHNRVGAEAMRRGDHSLADQHFRRALAIARRQSDWKAEAQALDHLGLLSEAGGDLTTALSRYDEAAVTARDALDEQGEFRSTLHRARVLLELDEVAASRDAADHAGRLAGVLGSRDTRAATQLQRARIARHDGLLPEAIALAREAVRLYDISPTSPLNQEALAAARLLLGELLAERGELRPAIEEFQRATDLARRASAPAIMATALTALADSLRTLGHLEDARLRYLAAYEANRARRDFPAARRNLSTLRELADEEQRIDRLDEVDRLLAELQQAERAAVPGAVDDPSANGTTATPEPMP